MNHAVLDVDPIVVSPIAGARYLRGTIEHKIAMPAYHITAVRIYCDATAKIELQVSTEPVELTIYLIAIGRDHVVLNAQRTLELANVAYSMYLTQKPAEQAELLKKVLLNCSIDAVSVTPTYRKPFDMIFERAKRKEWSGWADLSCRPLAPQASALPG